jgi:signal transduction histidine kinase/CheY-like chemotaxis protein
MKLANLINYRKHFSARIFLTFSALIIIITFAFTIFFFRYQSRSLKDKVESKGELLASLLAYNARLGVFTENADLLTSPVNGILEDQEVLAVAVYSYDGKTLVLQNRPGSRSLPDADKWDTGIGKKLTAATPSFHFIKNGNFIFWTQVALKPVVSEEDTIYFNTASPKNIEQAIGFVTVTMDGGALRKGLHGLLLKSIFIGFVFLLAGSVNAFLISRRITKSLHSLTEGANSLGMAGEYKEITVETGDEIGNLAKAFNDMVGSLIKREAEKEELEEQLRHSQKMEAIGTLAGGVAHDFNNILMAINGYGTLIQSEVDEESKLWKYAGQIVMAGERAANLTHRLLAFTRKQIITPRPIIIDEIITNIENMLTRLITENIELRIHLDAKDAIVVVDPGQLDQVLINLVANARDAMLQGGSIIITTAIVTLDNDFVRRYDQSANAGEYALITVSDSGAGMTENIMGKIFDPFFTTKEVGKGTGLGLSMVYGIIKQHNGIIDVASNVGRGSIFRIYLPLVESAMIELQDKVPVCLAGNRETILVAEDDLAIMSLLKELLEDNGYNVITATNGEEAVKQFIIYQDKISLLLLDVIMPKKNGWEVYSTLIGIRPDIKVLFMSGYTSDLIDLKSAFEEGINLIHKPVKTYELLAKLRELLEASN